MHCTNWPWVVARAVPGIGSAFVSTLVIAAPKTAPATLVLGLKASAVYGAAAKRTANVEAVKESLGLEFHINPQALASTDAGAVCPLGQYQCRQGQCGVWMAIQDAMRTSLYTRSQQDPLPQHCADIDTNVSPAAHISYVSTVPYI